MARYLEVAAQATSIARDLVEMVPEDQRPAAAELVARIANLAVRACPRGVQHTVRHNIVAAVVRGLPVRIGMEERSDLKTGRTYHALVTQQVVDGKGQKASVEGPAEDAS